TRIECAVGLGADIAFYLVAAGLFFYLLRYYATGAGGPTLLAVTAVPLTYAVVILNDLRRGDLYPALPPAVSAAIAAACVAFSFYAAWYLVREFDQIRIYRLGIWSAHDLAVGGVMAALILEYTRRRYF